MVYYLLHFGNACHLKKTYNILMNMLAFSVSWSAGSLVLVKQKVLISLSSNSLDWERSV